MTLEKPAAGGGRFPLHIRIFIGLAAGAALGLLARAALSGETVAWIIANAAQPLGQVFLRLVFMAVVPLVVSALILGVAELGDVSKVGRIGLRSLALTLVFSSIAVIIGVFGVNWLKPGAGLAPEARANLMASLKGQAAVQANLDNARKAKPAMQAFVELIPKNPFSEAVGAFEGGLIPLMTFSLIVGLALCSVGPSKAQALKDWLASVQAVMLKIIDFAMVLAPFGVGGLIFSVTAAAGVEVLGFLMKYFFLVIGALAVHLIFVYSVALKVLARRAPIAFFRDSSGVLLTAFATSSSSATLPLALKTSEEKLGIPRPIGSFVLTIGATANQNGTALYEGVTVLFLAQFFGIPLTFGQQVLVGVWSILAGVGTAGVPGGSLPLIVIVLESIGVPGEAIGLILGVDRLLDMSRTVLNVAGDLTIAACVAEWER